MPQEAEQHSMSRELKWMIGGLLSVALCLISLGGPGVYYLGQMSGQMEEMKKTQAAHSATINALIKTDITDFKARLSVLEKTQILPGAERELEKLEHRVRELEKK